MNANGHHRAPRGWWFIYFYGTEDGSEVRLGRTKQSPYSRRLQHQHDNGRDTQMRTLAVVLGQASDEGELKQHFAAYRSRPRSKEWIAAGDEMRSYLRWLRSQSFVARNETELEAVVPVEAERWLPGADRARTDFRQPALWDREIDPWGDLEVDRVDEGDFYTHPDVIEAARAAMGSIDLDPASCRVANEVVQAARFYSFRENGLLHEWVGNIWLNPPFGNWPEWVPKAIHEWHSGRVQQMCVLCESRATTAHMFHPIVAEADVTLVMKGRYAFWGPKASSTPDEGHAIFYFGSRTAEFRDAYALFGTSFQRMT